MHLYDIITAADVSLAAATAKSVLAWINGATRRSRVLEITIGFNSQTSTDAAVLIELVQFDTDGTGTSVTPAACEPGNPAAIGTAKYNYSAEPTTNPVVRWTTRCTPQQGGTLVYQVPMTRERACPVSKLTALRLTAAQVQSGVRATMQVEE
jgi:hypothetical protein